MPRSVPLCASVRHIVPDHSPLIIRGRYACLSASLPWAAIVSAALSLSPEYIRQAMLPDTSISPNASEKPAGRPWPPHSGAAVIVIQPSWQ